MLNLHCIISHRKILKLTSKTLQLETDIEIFEVVLRSSGTIIVRE